MTLLQNYTVSSQHVHCTIDLQILMPQTSSTQSGLVIKREIESFNWMKNSRSQLIQRILATLNIQLTENVNIFLGESSTHVQGFICLLQRGKICHFSLHALSVCLLNQSLFIFINDTQIMSAFNVRHRYPDWHCQWCRVRISQSGTSMTKAVSKFSLSLVGNHSTGQGPSSLMINLHSYSTFTG